MDGSGLETEPEAIGIVEPVLESVKEAAVSGDVSIEHIPRHLLVGADAVNALRPDSDFVRYSWDRLKEIIGSNQLSLLGRVPSDLRKYILWKAQTIEKYGKVSNFILQERLHWGPGEELAAPSGSSLFECRSDYKILMNDFPYGFEKGIVHVVVWTKLAIPKLDTAVADLTPAARAAIEEFVDKTFRLPLEMQVEDILWFKNWAALMSVRDIDHFHVLLNRPPVDERLVDILGEDVDVKRKWAAIDPRVEL
ncbi:hypothetical protein BZA70DRAFT_286422 [Myxozyma melibiosi]|uniref:N-acetylglucosamine-induced protein 1 n=1 Tax=Myxozyma melibiosi TaxID=54550 RepID=A0ABR1FCZ0_9ASCO